MTGKVTLMRYVLEAFLAAIVYFLFCLKYQLNRSDRNHTLFMLWQITLLDELS
jgi:hypothetical protein